MKPPPNVYSPIDSAQPASVRRRRQMRSRGTPVQKDYPDTAQTSGREADNAISDDDSFPIRTFSPEHFRRERLLQLLEPIINSTPPSLLLCAGNNSFCSIYPVRIGESSSAAETWQQIRTGWYDFKGHWRKYLPCYRVQKVEVVKVRASILTYVLLLGAISITNKMTAVDRRSYGNEARDSNLLRPLRAN